MYLSQTDTHAYIAHCTVLNIHIHVHYTVHTVHVYTCIYMYTHHTHICSVQMLPQDNFEWK